jgi:hypothetical protein
MKSIFSSKIALFFMAIVASVFIVIACGKIEDLTKDIQLKVDGDIIKIPVSLQFVDPQDSVAPDVTISLVGTDANKLFTTIADRDFKVVNGIIDLAVKKTDAPNLAAGRKLDFTVVATSKSGKYLRTVRNVILTDTTVQFVTIPMVNLNKLPAGVTKATGTVTVGDNGAATTQTVATTGTEKLEVTIPAGTKMYAADGTELKGTVNVQVLRFSGLNDDANRNTLMSFPGGFDVPRAVDETGKPIAAGTFTTAGFIAVDMEVGGKAVKTFSGAGATINMDITPGVKDDKGNVVKPGDVIPVWSLNEADGSWKKETTVTVGGTAAKPTATYSQAHLSYWNLDWYSAACFIGANVTIPSNVAAGWYYVEIIMGNGDGRVIKSTYMSIIPGQKIQFYLAPSGSYQLKLYYGNAFCRGDMAYRSADFQLCGGNTTTTMTAVTTRTSLNISVFVSGYCQSRPNLAINPNVVVYYKKSGCYYWSPLGVMTGGFLWSQGILNTSESYDFYVVMGGSGFAFYNKTVPPESRYFFPNILIPQLYCNQIL